MPEETTKTALCQKWFAVSRYLIQFSVIVLLNLRAAYPPYIYINFRTLESTVYRMLIFESGGSHYLLHFISDKYFLK